MIHKAKKSLGLKPEHRFARAKKSLGQNFLKSEIILKKIVEAGEVSENDTVLEIGPGKGALTKKLLEQAGTVIAVEKDQSLFSFLQEKFKTEINAKKLILLNEDILNFTPQQNYKIIANIPYNITGAILKKFLTEEKQPTRMVLMVQHEVAKRILAGSGKESILSISIKAYGEPKMILKVGKRFFSPQPKVDSAVILIKNISRKFFEENNLNENNFWQLIHASFAHKRKKLSSNLKTFKIGSSLELGNKRAEDLSLADWLLLTKN